MNRSGTPGSKKLIGDGEVGFKCCWNRPRDVNGQEAAVKPSSYYTHWCVSIGEHHETATCCSRCKSLWCVWCAIGGGVAGGDNDDDLTDCQSKWQGRTGQNRVGQAQSSGGGAGTRRGTTSH